MRTLSLVTAMVVGGIVSWSEATFEAISPRWPLFQLEESKIDILLGKP